MPEGNACQNDAGATRFGAAFCSGGGDMRAFCDKSPQWKSLQRTELGYHDPNAVSSMRTWQTRLLRPIARAGLYDGLSWPRETPRWQ